MSSIEFDKTQTNSCMLKQTLKQALSNSKHTGIFEMLSCFLIFERYVIEVQIPRNMEQFKTHT